MSTHDPRAAAAWRRARKAGRITTGLLFVLLALGIVAVATGWAWTDVAGPIAVAASALAVVVALGMIAYATALSFRERHRAALWYVRENDR